jgi:hypothetical protein
LLVQDALLMQGWHGGDHMAADHEGLGAVEFRAVRRWKVAGDR